MNGWWLVPMLSLAGDLPPEAAPQAYATAVTPASEVNLRELQFRHARRRIRDLRLDIDFAERRIRELRHERVFVHRTVHVDGSPDEVLREVDRVFDERETRLRERLDLLLGQLEAAVRRLNDLSVEKSRLSRLAANRNTNHCPIKETIK